MIKCPNCGAYFDGEVCSYCGYTKKQETESKVNFKISSKSKVIYLILLITLGLFGAHRFYLGKCGSGILYLFTAGLFSFGWLYDILKVIFSRVYDSDGAEVL